MAKKKETIEAKLSDLIFDEKNANKHTEFGMSLLEKSLSKLGAGRSILIDKNNNIIAGNGITETAGNIGLENVRIIETDGNEIIAVKRTDIDINSKIGREMALADNATNKANLQFDEVVLESFKSEFELDASDWGVNFDNVLPDFGDEEEKQNNKITNVNKCPKCGFEWEKNT